MSSVSCRPQVVAFCAGLLACTALPAGAQEVQWRPDYSTARREAREKNRPLVLDFGTESCFWCKKLDKTTFGDPSIIKLLNEHFIPIKVDGEKDAPLAQALGIDSYPTVVFASPDGKILGTHSGFVNAADFGQQLQQALASVRPVVPEPTVVRGAMSAVGGGDTAAAGVHMASVRITGPYQEPMAQAQERVQHAQELLALAREDYRTQQYAGCLEHCRALADSYPGSPEGTEAARMIIEIQSNREQSEGANLTDRMGMLYLELAEIWLRKNQPQEAVACLERIARTCPGTHHAAVAQEQLRRIRGEHPQ